MIVVNPLLFWDSTPVYKPLGDSCLITREMTRTISADEREHGQLSSNRHGGSLSSAARVRFPGLRDPGIRLRDPLCAVRPPLPFGRSSSFVSGPDGRSSTVVRNGERGTGRLDGFTEADPRGMGRFPGIRARYGPSGRGDRHGGRWRAGHRDAVHGADAPRGRRGFATYLIALRAPVGGVNATSCGSSTSTARHGNPRPVPGPCPPRAARPGYGQGVPGRRRRRRRYRVRSRSAPGPAICAPDPGPGSRPPDSRPGRRRTPSRSAGVRGPPRGSASGSGCGPERPARRDAGR